MLVDVISVNIEGGTTVTIDTPKHPTRGAHATLPASPRPVLVLAVVLVAALAINVETTIVNVALPTLNSALGASTRGLQWIVDAYNLAFAALVLAGGTVGDKFGRRGTLIAGLALFAASSVGAALCTSTGPLIGVRLVMGVAAALIYPTTLAIITDTFRDPQAARRRDRRVGRGDGTRRRHRVRSSAARCWRRSGGAACSWPWHRSPLRRRDRRRAVRAGVDDGARRPARPWWSAAVGRDARRAGVHASSRRPTTAGPRRARCWGSASRWSAAVAFVWWERRQRDPLIDVSLFANLRFSAASGAVTVAFFALFGFIFLITQFFQLLQGFGPLETGVRILPVALSIAVGSVLGTQLAVTRLGTKAVVFVGLLMLTAAFAWVATVDVDVPYLQVAAQMVLLGGGLGLTTAPATDSIMGVVRPEQAGAGSAVNDATRQVGGTLGVAVVGSIFSTLYIRHLSDSEILRAAPACRSGDGARGPGPGPAGRRPVATIGRRSGARHGQ